MQREIFRPNCGLEQGLFLAKIINTLCFDEHFYL